MKKILALVAILAFASCIERNDIEIDGCQYIETISNNGDGMVSSLTHKGNCTNPIHVKRDTVFVDSTRFKR